MSTDKTQAQTQAQTYVLKKPFVARQSNADTEFAELPVPELVTVGMMRKITASTSLLFAIELTQVCAGLDAFQILKLHTADAAGYAEAVNPLLQANDEPSFEVPAISAFKPLLSKITVDANRAIEFVAQVLQHSGMSKADIDAMDYRGFAPAVPLVMGMFLDPKA